MDRWLTAALDYVPRWLGLQMRASEQPGCAIAVALDGKVIFEQALGYANLERGVRLTPRHRFRIASHSKSFTAAGIMKLRERGKLKLDDEVGKYVENLHPRLARATISQVLSHTAGLVRDGPDSGQFLDRRHFLDARELRADLRAAPIIEANARFKYSNHGYGLLGLAIEAIAGEPYVRWIAREVVQAAGTQGYGSRHAVAAWRAVRARSQRQVPARAARHHPRRQSDARHCPRRRLREHGARPCRLLQSAVA